MNEEERTKILTNISKKSKVEVAELEKEYQEIFNTLPPSDDREKQALKQVSNKNVGGGEDNTEDFELIVIGLRQLTDFSGKTVREILSKYESNKEEMLESGKIKLIEGKPTVIDLQEGYVFNGATIKNKNFGQPLLPKWSRNTLVLARKPGDTTWVISSFALRGEHAISFDKNNMFTTMTVNCLGTIADGLKSGKSTKYIGFDHEFKLSQLIAETCGDHVQQLGDAYKYAEGLETTDYERFIVTSGTVQFINEPKNAGQSYNGSIDDLTTDHLDTIFVDPILGKPEAKKDYTFICQTSIKDKKDKDKNLTGEKQLILNVLGYY